MKRIQLFEFEDLTWFPAFLRQYMMRFITTMHGLLDSSSHLKTLVEKGLKHSSKPEIIDLCSGGGGPMPEVINKLKSENGIKGLKLTMTDLYPDKRMAKKVSYQNDPSITYSTTSMDATNVPSDAIGLRTMICSMHHMKPDTAKLILKNTMEAQQPICIYEISDNSFQKAIWWIAFPINILTTLLITPMVRPFSLGQLIFTYLIPILPIVIAWDGALSNARTYTLEDMDQILEGLNSNGYSWEKGSIKGKGGNKLYLLGLPEVGSN